MRTTFSNGIDESNRAGCGELSSQRELVYAVRAASEHRLASQNPFRSLPITMTVVAKDEDEASINKQQAVSEQFWRNIHEYTYGGRDLTMQLASFFKSQSWHRIKF
jgi:hypothetical protein